MNTIFGVFVSRGLQTGTRYAVAQSARALQQSRHLSCLRTTPSRLRKQSLASRPTIVQSLRFQSDDATSRPLTDSARSTDAQDSKAAAETEEEREARKALEPAYQMTFTCRRCVTRSSHRITKQAYHHGTTLITCPECKSRHLISDHLNIFSDKRITVEDILKEKGEFLKKGRLGEDGDIEFYPDPIPENHADIVKNKNAGLEQQEKQNM